MLSGCTASLPHAQGKEGLGFPQGLLCTGHRRWGSLSASAPSRRLCLGKAGQQVPYALRSCQRQAHSLRRWLELSREEPQPEDQEAEQQVQEELRKVRHGRPGGLRAARRAPGWGFLSAGPLSLRWRCRSSSWPTSCRPGASLSTPASLGSRPCGRLCASHHVQEQNAERQCFLVYFKMLQLNESLFKKKKNLIWKPPQIPAYLLLSQGHCSTSGPCT